MLIAQMTDIHIGFEPDARPEELNRKRFRDVLMRLGAQPNRPDMLVLSGDITDRGDEESFARTAELLADLPFPVHAMMGNHDTREGMLHAFPDTGHEGGFLHRAIEAAGLLILLLDTYDKGRHGGAFCAARRDWLRAKLAAHEGQPTVIFMHHPPVAAGIEWMDPHPQESWIRNFAAALAGFEAQVQAIHCGHLHRPISARFCGIPVSVTPSVAPLVSLDLRPISSAKADQRALITSEPPSYALHYWDGTSLVTHYETVCDWDVIAYYGPYLQPMIRDMEEERRIG